MEQFFPVKPAVHRQEKSLTPSMQVPPFTQGFEYNSHSSISKERKRLYIIYITCNLSRVIVT